MKERLLPIFVSLFVFISCTKDEAPNPDLSSLVEGSYPVASVTSNGQTFVLAQLGVQGSVSFAKLSLTTTTFRYRLLQAGTTPIDNSTTVYLTEQGGGVTIYSDAAHQKKIGTATTRAVEIESRNGLIKAKR